MVGRGRSLGHEAYRPYRDLFTENAARAKVEVCGWVLTPNTARLILVPPK
jgi:hypothetical protein